MERPLISGIHYSTGEWQVSPLTESTKEEPTPQTIRMPMMIGVISPWIEILTFDSNILNWQLLWEEFQAAVHDKPQLGEADTLTYLWDTLKDGLARNIIQGLIQIAESYQEAIKCLKDCYKMP